MAMLQQIWNRFGKKPVSKELVFENKIVIDSVAIFGGAHVPEGDSVYKSVVAVSKALAEAGITVINGGGPGVMKASTVGAKQGNGKVIGVTMYPKDMQDFEGRDLSNKIDEEIKTDTYIERTLTLMDQGRAYVVFNGGTGTISEFGMAWGLAKLYFGHHKPLILYGKFWQNITEAFRDNMMIRPEELQVYKIVDSPEGVLQAIRDFEYELNNGEYSNIKASRGDRQKRIAR